MTSGSMLRSNMSETPVFLIGNWLRKVRSSPNLFTVASKITRTHPDYNGYTNNCQNFVRYLLAFACQESVTPNTIELAVKSLWTDLTSNVCAAYGSIRRLSIGSAHHGGASQRGGITFANVANDKEGTTVVRRACHRRPTEMLY
jgi:hypothetical protein